MTPGERKDSEAAPSTKDTSIPSLLPAVLCAFLVLALSNMFPVGLNIAAPIYCPKGTQEHAVVTRITGTGGRGGNSINWNIYCLDSTGIGVEPSTLLVEALIFFETLAGAWVVIALSRALKKRAP